LNPANLIKFSISYSNQVLSAEQAKLRYNSPKNDAGQQASHSVAIIDSQSVKTAEKKRGRL
jgi:hypothetical protein